MLIVLHSTCKITYKEQCPFGSDTVVMDSKLEECKRFEKRFFCCCCYCSVKSQLMSATAVSLLNVGLFIIVYVKLHTKSNVHLGVILLSRTPNTFDPLLIHNGVGVDDDSITPEC
jgi:hypothetical protein